MNETRLLHCQGECQLILQESMFDAKKLAQWLAHLHHHRIVCKNCEQKRETETKEKRQQSRNEATHYCAGCGEMLPRAYFHTVTLSACKEKDDMANLQCVKCKPERLSHHKSDDKGYKCKRCKIWKPRSG